MIRLLILIIGTLLRPIFKIRCIIYGHEYDDFYTPCIWCDEPWLPLD